VLVVEDEPDIASFLGAFFRASGTDVVHVDPSTAGEVVERAATLDAACALVDLNLAGITGFEVIEALRADTRVSSLPVIIVTADARPATQQRAAALGAVGFVPKPFNVKDLLATVEAILDARGTKAPAATGADEPDEPGPTVTLGASGASSDPTTSREPERNAADLISADAVHSRLAAALSAGKRNKVGTTFALIRLAGTSASPTVIGEVARALVPALGGAELVGATAADELALLFPTDGPDVAGPALAATIGDGRLEVQLGAGRTATIELRAGLAGCPDHATTGEELYMAADIALTDALAGDEATVTAR